MPPNFWERKNRRVPTGAPPVFCCRFLLHLCGCVGIAFIEGRLCGKGARTPACRGFQRPCLFGRKVRCPQEAVRGVPRWWEARSTELGGLPASLYLPFPWRNHCGFSPEGASVAVPSDCLSIRALSVPSPAAAFCRTGRFPVCHAGAGFSTDSSFTACLVVVSFAPCARFHAKMSASRAANRASNPCVVGR